MLTNLHFLLLLKEVRALEEELIDIFALISETVQVVI